MHTKIDPSHINLEIHAVLWIHGQACFIDRKDLPKVTPYKWKLKFSLLYVYAYREYEISGKVRRVYMHRDLSGCPKNKVVHHINYCGLDNRLENLKIMTAEQNHLLHDRSKRPKKFPKKTTTKRKKKVTS